MLYDHIPEAKFTDAQLLCFVCIRNPFVFSCSLYIQHVRHNLMLYSSYVQGGGIQKLFKIFLRVRVCFAVKIESTYLLPCEAPSQHQSCDSLVPGRHGIGKLGLVIVGNRDLKACNCIFAS